MSQSFNLPSQQQQSQQQPQQQPSTTQDNNDQLQRWVPQPSTTQYEQPRIMDFGPLQGHMGDNFFINVCNLNSIDPNLLRIAFDSCITSCHFTLNTVTQVFTIHSIVPSCELSRVPIYLIVQQAEQILDSWFVGYFTFFRSRKRSTDTSSNPIEDNNNAKRPRQHPSVEQQSSFQINPNYQPSNYYGLTSHAPYVGLPPTQPSPRQRDYYEENPMLGYPSTAYRTQDSTNFQPSFDDGTFISSATTSAPILAPQQQQPQDPYIMPLMETIHQQPSSILTPAATTTSATGNTNTNTATSSNTPNIQMKPTLPLPLQQQTQISSTYPSSIATTSTSSQQRPPSSNSAMLTSDPFANLINKANLIFEGDLETMTKDWTAEEWENQRRLVQFWRRQEGNEVTSRFEPFQMPSEKSKQPDLSKLIVVSCIYYKEKNDYYVTSVDCIYLLEHLIGVKFTVEEKNRIRRNLEGYKPLTVSKLKPESAEFFKLIMGFPNPKPRNIEKDVKVFPWSILGVALKKIISKYTASYSSTLSVNYDVLSSTTDNTNSNTTASTNTNTNTNT